MTGRLSLAFALGLLAPGVAQAWTHTGFAWVPQEDFPVPFSVAPRADCEETVVNEAPEPRNICEEIQTTGFDTWRDQAGCAEVSGTYVGESPNIGFFIDYEQFITFNDPGSDGDTSTRLDDDITDVGTLAVTRSWPGEVLFSFNGKVYNRQTDADIVFENDVAFATPEQIENEACNGRVDMQGVATHEIGHLFGMGHSCEEGDPCLEPRLKEATMNWSAPNCSTSADDLNEDDVEGITALYGPSASFACSNQLSDDLALGVVPFDLKCSIVSEYRSEITNVEWRWGDGSAADSGTALQASHTYTTSGNFTVEVEVDGDRDACGEAGWNNSYRKVGFVRACATPAPEFEINHVDGLSYQMRNDTDVSVYGCYSNIEWQVYSGETVSPDALLPDLTYAGWEPKINFPDEGTYTVVLNIGGPGGTGAAKATFDARDRRGAGYGACDSAAGGSSALALSGLVALALRRRARR